MKSGFYHIINLYLIKRALENLIERLMKNKIIEFLELYEISKRSKENIFI